MIRKHLRSSLLLGSVVLLWLVLMLVAQKGETGRLESSFFRETIYPSLSRFSGSYTDFKFRARGPEAPRGKIVIVAIDDETIAATEQRWPWHRDLIAVLAMTVLDHGPKAVGLDIVFPERDIRVSPDLEEFLAANELGEHAPSFETDLVLKRIIDLYKDKLALGWMSDDMCRPGVEGDACSVDIAELSAFLPEGFEKFGFDELRGFEKFDKTTTSIVSAPTVVSNLAMYNESAVYSGFLVSGVEEHDEVIRRMQLAIAVGDTLHPSMPLVMAGMGRSKGLEIELGDEGLVERIGLEGEPGLDVSETGAMNLNFRGPAKHFAYVSALELLAEAPLVQVERDGVMSELAPAEVLKDAYVLIGVSAIGAHDLKTFPFGSNILGTEGLATALDNILAGDPVSRHRGVWGTWLLALLMTLGAGLFCFAMIRLSALPAVLVSIASMGAFALFDIYYVFGVQNVNLNSVFFLAQLGSIFVVAVSMKYVFEERRKKVIRGTFSKYLAPAVVDEMLRDPENLRLGGETRELTIMMSDLRGFTATAERLEAAEVLEMLNHYLGTMADIIVDFEGTIDEFIGDAILVIFGAPISRPDDARRAVACCLAMQKAMKDINEHNTGKGLPRLEMGIALNTGPVTVGNIGSQRRLKYGVVGSHVNLTARIESNTVGGQLLISESTLALAGDDIKTGEVYSLIAKGFPDPIVAHEILGIGGEYDIYLDEVDLALVAMEPELSVRFRVMRSKNDEGEELSGGFVEASVLGALLRSPEAVDALTNLKIMIYDGDDKIEGDLYAKVVSGGNEARLRFTAVPPTVKAFLVERTASQAADIDEPSESG